MVREYVYGSYVDEVVAYRRIQGTTSSVYYPQYNHLYSVAAVTDGAGVVVERFTYDAYGRQTATVEAGQVASGFGRGFTGYIADNESGLLYARARMYSPTLGRFISRDPWMLVPLTGRTVEVKGLYGTKASYYWGPNAKDGYHDGYGLYGAYFVPNRSDPTGEICWPWACYFSACMMSMGVPVPSSWYTGAAALTGTAAALNAAATAGVVTTTTSTALGTITVTTTPTVGALATGATTVAGGTVVGGAATVAGGALASAAAGIAAGCAANATAHKAWDCFWCAETRDNCNGFSGLGQDF